METLKGSLFVLLSMAALLIGPAEAAGPDTAAGGGGIITLNVPVSSPLFADVAVAEVNGHKITVEDVKEAVSASHGESTDEKKKAEKIDYSKIVRRLINVKLIFQEAGNIGIDELPEVKGPVEVYARTTLRDLLVSDITKDIKPDEAQVDKFYKDLVKEWKIRSALFAKDEDAQGAEKEISGGKEFNEVVAKAISEGKAKGASEGSYVKPKDMLPAIADKVSGMKTGDVSPVIKVPSGKNEFGYVVLRLEDIRYPENPEEKEKARAAVLAVQMNEAVKSFKRDVLKKDVTFNKGLLKSLNFEKDMASFEKLMKDMRKVASIKGDKPVTVGDLAKALNEKFYHGIDEAIKEKKVNKKKFEVLDEILEKRLFRKEAVKRGIEKSPRYLNLMKNYRESIVFGAFVQKVVYPDIKITEDELKAYYGSHKEDYQFPAMVKLDSLAFGKALDAEAALEKLTKGADYGWIKANAEGQLPEGTSVAVSFRGNALTVKDLPEDVSKLVSNAKAGDARIYTGSDSNSYLLFVRDVIPASQEPYEDVRADIAKKVSNERLNKAVEDWAEKLGKSADIKIYVVDLGK